MNLPLYKCVLSYKCRQRIKWVMKDLVFGTGGQGVSLRHWTFEIRGGLYCRPTTFTIKISRMELEKGAKFMDFRVQNVRFGIK